MQRRLAAILAIDMVGYSRLMGADEHATLDALRRHSRQILNPRATRYRGRVVKSTGDGALMVFSSVVDAVAFAVDVQLALRKDNAGLPEERQYRYRIGLNIGDIVVERGDIFGDGVNIAARLEAIAGPGEICLSKSVYDQVRGKLDLTVDLLGERQVKNIAEPLTVYQIRLDDKAAALVSGGGNGIGRHRIALVAAVVAIAVAMAWVWWWWQPWAPVARQLAAERLAYPLPDRPSVAVMPFVTSDPNAEHLADGLTDDLITELSKVSGLFVIARHSVFALKGSASSIQDVAAKLGVNFVVEGTLQRAESRLRINVNLIDALTGLSLWAERYDRKYADIFAVQDDVTGKIITALSVRLSDGERNHLARIPTDNLEAYDYYLRAEKEGILYSDVEAYRRTLSFYQKAIDLDPDFAEAHAGVARVAVEIWRNDYNLIWPAAVARKVAYDAAGTALTLDGDNARAHTVLALLQLVDGHEAEAIDSARRAVAMQPSDPEAVANLALVLAHAGRHDEALAEVEKALRLDPSPSANFRLLAGIVFSMTRQPERAAPLLEAARDALPDVEPAHEYLAAAYGHRGDHEAAAVEAARLLELFPDSNLTYYELLYDYWRAEDRAHHLAGLAAAGIPKWPFRFNGRASDRLGEAELTALVSGTTWTGRHKNGTGFVQYFDHAGNTAYRSANTSVTGVIEVRGDRLCERFEGYFLDRMACGEVYRNTAPEIRDADYVHVSPQALKYFTVSGR